MSLESVEVVVRGYRAFVDGNLDAIADLLDADVEWYPLDAGPASYVTHGEALGAITDRSLEDYRVELERCVAVGDKVVVGLRAVRDLPDPNDARPLQSRRKYSVERYAAVVTIRNGRVVRVQDCRHLPAAFEAAGIADDA